MIVPTFNPSTWEASRLYELEASLIYIVSSKTARRPQRVREIIYLSVCARMYIPHMCSARMGQKRELELSPL